MSDVDDIARYDYALPPELIADVPAERRELSRLMRVGSGRVAHLGTFEALVDELRAGDLLVVNDVRVQPVRLYARRETGGRVELLLLDAPRLEAGQLVTRCFMRAGRRLRDDEVLTLEREGGPTVRVHPGDRQPDGATRVAFDLDDLDAFDALCAEAGQLPLPPYIIKRRRAQGRDDYTASDRDRYQTVYARQGRAIAAPTAGLHFTHDLLARLAERGVERAAVTLEVGAGTFKPVQSDHLDDHEMHDERYVVDASLVDAFARARARGGRVIAVGTTVVRALEDQMVRHGELIAGAWSTRLFIRPGFEFRAIDGLLTNFHLPRSTLLVLVSALAGHELVMRAYREAVDDRYRFYSYGDCMLVWPPETDEAT